MDERIDFAAFDLPGQITVSSARVRSELAVQPDLSRRAPRAARLCRD